MFKLMSRFSKFSLFKSVKQNTDCFEERANFEYGWFKSRRLIMLCGSILSVIYGLAILTATLWLKTEITKLSKPLSPSILYMIRGYIIFSIQIMFTGIISSIAPFKKYDRTKPIENAIKQKSRKSNSNVFFAKILSQCVYSWFVVNSLLMITIIIVLIMIPMEAVMATYGLSISKHISSDIEICMNCEKVKQLVYRLLLFLSVLLASVIIIQICLIILAFDLLLNYYRHEYSNLIYSQKRSHKSKNRAPLYSNSSNQCISKKETIIHLKAEKNSEFCRFVKQNKCSIIQTNTNNVNTNHISLEVT